MLFEKKAISYHLIAPLVLGIVVGVIEFVQSRSQITGLASMLFQPVFSAYLIWGIMFPTTALINTSLQSKPIPLPIRLILASLIGSVPLSIILPWALAAIGLEDSLSDQFIPNIEAYDELIMERYFRIFFAVSVIWLAFTYKWYQRLESGQTDRHTEITTNANNSDPNKVTSPEKRDAVQSPPPPVFVSKMKRPIAGIPMAVAAEQHYIRVYSERGDELILFSFSDAVKSLEPFDGLQVHRSYWVARNAISEIIPKSKSYEILLKNGITIPVSKTYKKIVEGLISKR